MQTFQFGLEILGLALITLSTVYLLEGFEGSEFNTLAKLRNARTISVKVIGIGLILIFISLIKF